MNPLAAPLTDRHTQLGGLVREAATGGSLQGMGESELASLLGQVACTGRLIEALLIDTVGEVMRRSEPGAAGDRMTSHLGAHDVGELVQRIARVSGPAASRLQKAAKAVRPVVSDTTGELLEAEMPVLRKAMVDGVVGVDGVLAIASPLHGTAPRVPGTARRAAERVLVAEARGEGPRWRPAAVPRPAQAAGDDVGVCARPGRRRTP